MIICIVQTRKNTHTHTLKGRLYGSNLSTVGVTCSPCLPDFISLTTSFSFPFCFPSLFLSFCLSCSITQPIVTRHRGYSNKQGRSVCLGPVYDPCTCTRRQNHGSEVQQGFCVCCQGSSTSWFRDMVCMRIPFTKTRQD